MLWEHEPQTSVSTAFSSSHKPRSKPRGKLGEHEKACKSRAVRRKIYKLFEGSPNIPSGLLRQQTHRKSGLQWSTAFKKQLWNTLVKERKSFCTFVIKLLIIIEIMR